ncbi:MAG: ankyrin repeat domain-containing protein [Verrucomicrobiota bacterium]
MSKAISYLIGAIICLFFVGCGDEKNKQIYFLTGANSHKSGVHEHLKDAKLFADALNTSSLGIDAHVLDTGWPDDSSILSEADAIVVICDGLEKHVLNGRVDQIRKLWKKGMGIVVLHFALESEDKDLGNFLMDSIGARFQVGWSVNPIWEAKEFKVSEHIVSNGVGDFPAIEDEWYYHMKFRDNMKGVSPILSVVPSLDTLGKNGPRSGNPVVREKVTRGEMQHLSWVSDNGRSGRGFGFTGGHFHWNWTIDQLRKVILNGIVWVAKGSIPEGGVESERPLIKRNETLAKAIAKNDIEDIKVHVQIDSSVVNEQNKAGFSALHLAAIRNKPAILSLLADYGGKLDLLTTSKRSPLHLAIERGGKESVRVLIERGASLSLGDQTGWTPLHFAAAKNRLEIAKMLIEAGADVHKLSNAGGTALHEGAASGGKEIIKLLLEAGVDPGVKAEDGSLALDHAIKFKNEAAIGILDK